MSYIGVVGLTVSDKSPGTMVTYLQDDKYVVTEVVDYCENHVLRMKNGDLITSCDSFEVVVTGNRMVFNNGNINPEIFSATLNPYQWQKVLNYGLVGKYVEINLQKTKNKTYAEFIGQLDHEYIDGVME